MSQPNETPPPLADRALTFVVSVHLVAVVACIALILCAGCSTVQEQQSLVIEEAVILLENHSHPELPRFEAARVKFLGDAEHYRPKPSPSPTPVGAK